MELQSTGTPYSGKYLENKRFMISQPQSLTPGSWGAWPGLITTPPWTWPPSTTTTTGGRRRMPHCGLTRGRTVAPVRPYSNRHDRTSHLDSEQVNSELTGLDPDTTMRLDTDFTPVTSNKAELGGPASQDNYEWGGIILIFLLLKVQWAVLTQPLCQPDFTH